MKRSLAKYITQDLPNKIILITGPRRCGKTTLSKQLNSSFDYINFDKEEGRLLLKKGSWDRKKQLVIFDELHKMDNWERWLKGIYDTEGTTPNIVVTGSAKLDTYKKVGDSLAGRYFQFQMHPLDLKEAKQQLQYSKEEIFQRLWNRSGFPEPFLAKTNEYYKRWRKSHLDIILRQDLLDLHSTKNIKSIETLILLLQEKVGGSISYANLARDLEKDATTIKQWLQLLENLFVIFKVTPYSKNIARSLLKEPKYYFYDHARIKNDGAHLENIVASAILKELQFIEDTTGEKTSLHYLRTKDGLELDFLVCIDDKPVQMIEIKQSNSDRSKAFNHFKTYFPKIKMSQYVLNLKREETYPDGLEVRKLINWLADISFEIK